MKKFLTYFISVFAVAGVLLSPVSVLAVSKSSETVVLQKDQIFNKDYFAAGETVTIYGTVNGDAYIAGGNVIIEGTINGDLLAAGGNVNIRGTVRDDVRVIGGQVNVTGEVGRNITTLGGTVNIADSATVSGSLAAGAGSISIFTPIGKEANIGAGEIVLDSVVNGDMQAGVGRLILTPNAQILGDLTYWSEEKAQIDSNSNIVGVTTHNLPPQNEDRKEKVGAVGILAGTYSVFNLFSFLAALIVGLFITKLMPNFTQKTIGTIVDRPFLSVGIGFLSVVLSPFIFLLLLITVIGIPLDLILLAAFVIFIYISKIFIGIVLGQKILTFFNKKSAFGWALILGLFTYYVLSMIPVLGFIFWMITGLMGLGAILIGVKSVYADLRGTKRSIK